MKRGPPLSMSSVVSLVSLLVACTGVLGDPHRDGSLASGGSSGNPDDPARPFVPGEPAPVVFSCNPSAQPEELPLPRLSRTQLESTLRFAIRLALPDEESAIWAKVSPQFARYPENRRTPAPGDLKGGYARIDQSIQQTQIDAIYGVGSAIAQELTASAARISSMMGGCATDSSTANDRECLETFIAHWGARVMRSPLAAEDVAYYAGDASSSPVSPEAVADVITAILNAPQTLYRVEHGTEDSKAVSALSAFEVAARLTYHFWQAPPDDELWTAAQSGSLLDAAAYGSQLDRLVQSPLARAAVDELALQWLRLEELPPLDALSADPVFKAFAGAQLPPASARQAMIEDVLASMWSTLTSGGTLSDFLNDRHSYAQDDYLAGIYQTAPWDGVDPPPLFPSPQRSGLLTRAAMLATGTSGTRPIHKGYLVRNALLCQQVGAPPPNVNTNPPAPGASVTTRQAVTELTSGGICGGCHLGIINPPGFITEGFDGLGRERTDEKLFDAEGNVIASLPIDTSAIPEVGRGDLRAMDDAVELSQAVDESRLYHSCMARHYFRFALSRFESPELDGCLLSELEAAARGDKPLLEVLKVVAQSASFKARRFE
ncbi:MAG TPA: DUF1588 domain-containing protein [Polyangiaceae bacterium]|nr:DUF1588 domain-containing protein [Polyangiaceae bacterium]